ncbi:hypothetical protein AWE07_003028 [Escherichia coli]
MGRKLNYGRQTMQVLANELANKLKTLKISASSKKSV